jgi:release factor glutamine methyltransferase
VNSHTLIPRPETEMLVEFALEKIPAGAAEAVLDLGTGSGAIALAVKSERPTCGCYGSGCLSRGSRGCSQANAEQLSLSVEFVHGSWFSPLSGAPFLFDSV